MFTRVASLMRQCVQVYIVRPEGCALFQIRHYQTAGCFKHNDVFRLNVSLEYRVCLKLFFEVHGKVGIQVNTARVMGDAHIRSFR